MLSTAIVEIVPNNPAVHEDKLYFGCMLGCNVRFNCHLELVCGSQMEAELIIVNNLVPIGMGLLTAWFRNGTQLRWQAKVSGSIHYKTL